MKKLSTLKRQLKGEMKFVKGGLRWGKMVGGAVDHPTGDGIVRKMLSSRSTTRPRNI